MSSNNPAKLTSLRKPDYPGSWWKYTDTNTTTLPIGKFTPVFVKELPAKCYYRCSPEVRFESMPMVSPLYNGFSMVTKFFFYPIRLCVPELRRNAQMQWGTIPDLFFPVFSFYQDESTSSSSIYPKFSFNGSLLDRLNMLNGETITGQSFVNHSYYSDVDDRPSVFSSANMVPLIAYWDIWLRHEYNPQESYIPVTYDSLVVRTNGVYRELTKSYFSYDSLRALVDYFGGYATDTRDIGQGVEITDNKYMIMEGYEVVRGYSLFSLIPVAFGGYDSYRQWMADNWDLLSNFESDCGLLPITYKGGYYTSWFDEDGINILKNYMVQQGESFLSLRKQNADFMVDMLSLVSGNRYTDYLLYVMDTELELKDHPILVGSDTIDFGSIDFFASSQTGDGPNGVLAASASKCREYSNKVREIKFKTKEPGLFMAFSYLVPNVVFYQGTPRFMLKRNFADLWHPQYDAKGFQTISSFEVFNPYLGALEDYGGIGYNFENEDIAFVPLGYEYMNGVDIISGGMKCRQYSTWTLRRDYEIDGYERAYDEEQPISQFEYKRYIIDGVDSNLRTTYVDGFMYNTPFENVNSYTNSNFVVKYKFNEQLYMPITHKLITKTF